MAVLFVKTWIALICLCRHKISHVFLLFWGNTVIREKFYGKWIDEKEVWIFNQTWEKLEGARFWCLKCKFVEFHSRNYPFYLFRLIGRFIRTRQPLIWFEFRFLFLEICETYRSTFCIILYYFDFGQNIK